MNRIDLPHFVWAMESLVAGTVVNRIEVDPETEQWALVALRADARPAGQDPPGLKDQPDDGSICSVRRRRQLPGAIPAYRLKARVKAASDW